THSIIGIIYPSKLGSYLIICNRGPIYSNASNITAYRINSLKIDRACIDFIFSLRSEEKNSCLEKIYVDLPRLLSGCKDEMCAALESISPVNQKVNNCPAASRKAAIGALLSITAACMGVGTLTELVQRGKRNYKSFSTYLRAHTLE